MNATTELRRACLLFTGIVLGHAACTTTESLGRDSTGCPLQEGFECCTATSALEAVCLNGVLQCPNGSTRTEGKCSWSIPEVPDAQPPPCEGTGTCRADGCRENEQAARYFACASGSSEVCCTRMVTFPGPGQDPDDSGTDAEAMSCQQAGGACTGIGECGLGRGHMSSLSCGGAFGICCIPDGKCGGPEDFVCCDGSATYRPSCNGTTLDCPSGQTRQAPGTPCP